MSQSGEAEAEEEEEGRRSVGRKGPKMLKTVEQEEHARTHCPYRSWCRHCVKPRARNSPHGAGGFRTNGEGDMVKAPRVVMGDYFMSKEDEKASANPLVVMADEESGSKCARAVGQKDLGDGQEMSWLIEDMCTQLRAWGHAGGTGRELIVESDGEPAMLVVRNAMMKYHGGKIVPEEFAKQRREVV